MNLCCIIFACAIASNLALHQVSPWAAKQGLVKRKVCGFELVRANGYHEREEIFEDGYVLWQVQAEKNGNIQSQGWKYHAGWCKPGASSPLNEATPVEIP